MASSLRVNAIVPASGTNVAIGTAGGTITYAASVSGISTFSNGIIVSAGSSIGIGIANPTSPLEVQSSTIPRIISNYNNSKHIGMSVGGSGGGFTLTDGHFLTINHQPYTDRGTDNNFTERVRIDSSGRITTPYQPAFLAYSTGVSVTGGWSNLSSSLTTEAYDIGGNYGTSTAGRFVAPVAGRYLFYFGGFGNGSTVNERYAVCARINGGGLNFISGGSYSLTDTPLSGYSVVHNLAVNDYVDLFYYTAIANTWGASVHYVYWGGYLLG